MNNQEILDNAPEGATHVDTEGRWHKLTFNHKGFMLLNNDGDWDYCNPCTDLRSLADIKLIAELEKERIKLLSCLLDISDGCIGEITMNYRVDAEYIGRKIYAATGMANPQLTEALKEQVK